MLNELFSVFCSSCVGLFSCALLNIFLVSYHIQISYSEHRRRLEFVLILGLDTVVKAWRQKTQTPDFPFKCPLQKAPTPLEPQKLKWFFFWIARFNMRIHIAEGKAAKTVPGVLSPTVLIRLCQEYLREPNIW